MASTTVSSLSSWLVDSSAAQAGNVVKGQLRVNIVTNEAPPQTKICRRCNDVFLEGNTARLLNSGLSETLPEQQIHFK